MGKHNGGCSMALASGESRLRLLEIEMGMKGFEVCMAESGDLLFCGKATAVAAWCWQVVRAACDCLKMKWE